MGLKVMCLSIILLFFLSQSKMTYSESLFYPGESDFSKVVKAEAFIDKSFLIFDIFSYRFVHITAPRYFGKSTNLDMMRRFVEVSVDADGQPQQPNTTANYKIFESNNLTIFQYKDFVKKHFGRYPVLYINFSSFKKVGPLELLASKFEPLVHGSFLKHKYLLNYPDLFNNTEKEARFRKYCNNEVRMSSAIEISDAFKFLTKYLTRHFKKRVFVLVDDYDCHLEDLLFKSHAEIEKTIVFIHSVFEELVFENDEYVIGSLLTGVLRSSVRGTTSDYFHVRFLHDDDFSLHYGLTDHEVDNLLIKITSNEEERIKTKDLITNFYKGYTIIRDNTKQIYGTWSILNYINALKATNEAKCYWCKEDCFEILKSIFHIKGMKGVVKRLLSGKSYWMNIRKPIYTQNVIKYNSVLLNEQTKKDPQIMQFSIVLLYHFGFLTIVPNTTKINNEYRVRVPNKEVEITLRQALKDAATEKKEVRSK